MTDLCLVIAQQMQAVTPKGRQWIVVEEIAISLVETGSGDAWLWTQSSSVALPSSEIDVCT